MRSKILFGILLLIVVSSSTAFSTVDDTRHIQDWDLHEQKRLYETVLAYVGRSDVLDVCAIGSRVYSVIRKNSDIDIIVFLPDEAVRKTLPDAYTKLDDVRVSIKFLSLSRRGKPAFGGYHLCQYSLKTRILYEGNEADERAHRKAFGKAPIVHDIHRRRVDDTRHIQDWSPEEQEELYRYVLYTAGPQSIKDVLVVGSRVYSVIRKDSDIDIIVILPKETPSSDIPPKRYVRYRGTKWITMDFKLEVENGVPQHFKHYKTCAYSLKTHTLYEGTQADEIGYRKARAKTPIVHDIHRRNRVDRPL